MKMIFKRLEMLIGEDALKKLSGKHIMIFGVGGVGGYAAEAVARSGVGTITVVDFDFVQDTNINRQLCALSSTLGKEKALVTAQRLLDINPNLNVFPMCERYTHENSEMFFSKNPHYIIDAIDTVTDKVDLICEAKKRNIPIISAMGAGNKLDGGAFKVADISKTTTCPLARVIRKELKSRGIYSLKTVYSDELPVVKNRTPGSAVWTVGCAGLMLAGEVIRDLIKD